MPSFAELQRWCSPARLAAYRTEAGGDELLAVQLYEWNADLCGAFMEVMHHSEVVFRNRLHQELGATYPNDPAPWYKQGVLEPKGLDRINEAERRIVGAGNEATPGRVIAALPFGFWNALFGHGYEDLWRRCLHRCFRPNGPPHRKQVSTVTERVRLFRNRVAHHERLFHQDLRSRHDDLLKLAMWLDPSARDWILGGSRVLDVMASRPG